MAIAMDEILSREGEKYGIEDRIQLVRYLIGQFIANYEVSNNIIIARNEVRLGKVTKEKFTIKENKIEKYEFANEEFRKELPDVNNEEWDRLETDLVYREGFVLGLRALSRRIESDH